MCACACVCVGIPSNISETEYIVLHVISVWLVLKLWAVNLEVVAQ